MNSPSDSSAAPGTVPPAPASPVPTPAPVRHAFALWMTAVAAGAFETVLAVSGMAADGSGSAGEIGVGLTIRLTVFTAAWWCAVRMRRGHGWARLALTLGLGIGGTASMVTEPLGRLADGVSVGALLSDVGALDLAFAVSRTLHVLAVLTAVTLMFLPAANAYFTTARRSRASAATLPAEQ
ncbi:hypothetical protein ACH4RA_00500 [Streptomyces smyrnaeus]|uniref:hypothetical protein n=1 Tax=Streptomyces TaxID=1883 RepID=UPI001B368D0B|nr:hypothetical protein [Streptomyces sp. B15]MBQ1119341.1 hypothetical protein [Streptomyces sp. B15]MBQ1160322.1 hypothetical protein [Streptomyces sp. A73]